jgi:hypothetical protein
MQRLSAFALALFALASFAAGAAIRSRQGPPLEGKTPGRPPA